MYILSSILPRKRYDEKYIKKKNDSLELKKLIADERNVKKRERYQALYKKLSARYHSSKSELKNVLWWVDNHRT